MKLLMTTLAYLALAASLVFGFVVLTAHAAESASVAPGTVDLLVSLL